MRAAMCCGLYTVGLKGERGISCGSNRVTILDYHHSLPPAPDCILLQNIYILTLICCNVDLDPSPFLFLSCPPSVGTSQHHCYPIRITQRATHSTELHESCPSSSSNTSLLPLPASVSNMKWAGLMLSVDRDNAVCSAAPSAPERPVQNPYCQIRCPSKTITTGTNMTTMDIATVLPLQPRPLNLLQHPPPPLTAAPPTQRLRSPISVLK